MFKLDTLGLTANKIGTNEYYDVNTSLEYLAWIAEGNTPEPADSITVTYTALTPRQIRQALTHVGLRTQVESAVAAGSQDLKDWWEYSSAFERLHPQVIAMGTALGQTEQQLNDLWTLGASL